MRPTDERLLAEVGAGSSEAFSALVDLHWESLVRYGYGLTNEWDAAEDLAQDAFVRLWGNREKWRAGPAWRSARAFAHAVS